MGTLRLTSPAGTIRLAYEATLQHVSMPGGNGNHGQVDTQRKAEENQCP